jgi:calcium-dependent protein kinase
MHKQGVCHRDLKPENIIFTDRLKQTVKIVDFGLSKQQMAGMTTRIGTPYYVSPEVLRGKEPYSSQCDIWSFGVIVYFMLVGYPPFYAQSEA